MTWSVGEQSSAVSPFATPASAAVQPGGAGFGAASSTPLASSHGTGPFSPSVNALLGQCFGQPLDDISVARGEGTKNKKISAEAHTINRHISLGDHIKEDPHDAHSMEVIAHEVSHALASGGSGHHIINQAGDPGEHAAYDAGRQFKSFVSAGAKGVAPQLRPAHGGQAAIHRFEGGEHKNAVDGAVEVLQQAPPPNRAAVKVDPKVAALMTGEITLQNKMTVKPGDLTAMMGDFYGVFNKDGTFNPQKSYEAMTKADPKEMAAILERIHAEEKTVKSALNHQGSFEAASPKELEEITLNRKKTTDKDGAVSGLSMLELAERNNAHFSAKDSRGTDNNMGAYESFHKLALDAAKDGNLNLAKAYEASGMHFLTDRHAGGHQFEKAGVQEAYKEGGAINPVLKAISPALGLYDSARNSDTLSQAATHIVHDHFNEHGAQVGNASGDPRWLAKGDKHWADDDNADNRFQTAKSVYSSYAELQSVVAKEKRPNQIQEKGYAARQTVPQFDDGTQKEAEAMARKLSVDEVVKEEKGNLGVIGPFAKRKWVNAKNWVGDKWQGAKDLGGQALDWGKDKLHSAKDWAADKWQDAKDLGGQAVDWGKDKLHSAKDWATDKWQGAKDLGGQAVDWGKDKLHAAKDLGGQAVDWGKEKVSAGWDGAKNLASQGKDTVSSGWSWLKKKTGF